MAEQLGAFRDAGLARVMCQHMLHTDLDMVALIGEELAPGRVMGAEHAAPEPAEERGAAPAPPRGAGSLLALRAAAGNRAFGRIVRAALQRSPESEALHKVGVDDTWLADRLQAGALGTTADKRSIELRFFPGKTTRRALVIGGVHGTERQGVQVARLLEKDLAASPADFSVILVPVLFPDNAATGSVGLREGATPTNRNFPRPDKDLAASGGKDAQGRDILPENRLLMEVMERYRPERIISLHGTWDPAKAGVFYDPRKLTSDEQQQIELDAARSAGASARPRASDSEGSSEATFQQLYDSARKRGIEAKLAAAGAADKDLSLRAAKLIDAPDAGVKGREARNLGRGSAAPLGGRQRRPVGRPRHRLLGRRRARWHLARRLRLRARDEHLHRRAAGEPQHRRLRQAGGNTAGDKVTQADRQTELQAYADAVRTVLLAQ